MYHYFTLCIAEVFDVTLLKQAAEVIHENNKKISRTLKAMFYFEKIENIIFPYH